MSTKEGSVNTKGGKEVNTVSDDAIWRQVCRYELDWSRNWEQKWGFMRESTNKDILIKNAAQNDNVSNIPSKKAHLLKSDGIESVQLNADGKIDPEDMKSFYLLAHQIRKLQLAGGTPTDKYTFPATRNNDIGWWTVEASKRMSAANSKAVKFDQNNLNTLLDSKLFQGHGRVANITKNGQ